MSSRQHHSSIAYRSNDYRSVILSELNARKSRNALYSLRAFARDLGVSVTALSEGLAGKRTFSARNASRIAENLALAPSARRRFLLEAQGMEPVGDQDDAQTLNEDEFRLISDWYYLAVLSLAELPENRAEAKWVAKRLGISFFEAREAIERLTRLGHLVVDGRRLRRTGRPIRTTIDIPSSAIRNHHRQNLRRAEQTLDSVPVEKREISSMTFAISSARLDEAKKRIVKFKRQLAALLESEEPDEIYTLAIQFFPVVSSKARKEESSC